MLHGLAARWQAAGRSVRHQPFTAFALHPYDNPAPSISIWLSSVMDTSGTICYNTRIRADREIAPE